MLKKYTTLFICLLAVSSLACGLFPNEPTPVAMTSEAALPTPVITPTNKAQETAVSPTVSPPTPQPTTPSPTASSCVNSVEFIADIAIPDDTEIQLGTPFTKIWRVRNGGTCAWASGASWVFVSGAPMSGPAFVSLPLLDPGAAVDVAVDLIAPDAPGSFTGYWQVQLADGIRLDTRSFVRIIVPDPSPSPTPTAAVQPQPQIVSFSANVETADPGDAIQLAWETQHSDWVTLYRLVGYQLSSFWEVEAAGVMSYTIPTSERNSISFMLFASREGAESAQSDVAISLTCPDAWFFAPAPDTCPAQAALVSDAVEQPFEHGVMIWVKEQNRIYALFADTTSPKWTVYADDWTEGDQIDDPTIEPPPGMFQPVHGFGLVWREQPDVRDRLGWATAPEAAFNAAYQTTSRYKYNDSYLRALDGDVWLLLTERSGWEKINVAE